MVIKDLLSYAISYLKEADILTPQLDAKVLLCHILKCDSIYLIINDKKEVTPESEEKYKKLLKLRKENMPISYITNHKEFMSLDFYVDENVLIPRPDTEILVEYIIGLNCRKNRILDICCGSGCIGVSLAHYIKSSHITMLDISDKALEIAKRNATSNNAIDCEFIKMDILKDFPRNNFDIIVSNPPYICKETLKKLEPDVIDYEPLIALDGGESGLVFYERIANNAYQILNNGGVLAFEIGEEQAEDVFDLLFKNNFKNICIINDLAGRNRVVAGWKE